MNLNFEPNDAFGLNSFFEELPFSDVFFWPFLMPMAVFVILCIIGGYMTTTSYSRLRGIIIGFFFILAAIASAFISLFLALQYGELQRKDDILLIQKQVNQTYEAGISEPEAEAVRNAILDLEPTYDTIVLSDIDLLVDEAPVSVDLVYVDGEYRFYIASDSIDNPSIELSRAG